MISHSVWNDRAHFAAFLLLFFIGQFKSLQKDTTTNASTLNELKEMLNSDADKPFEEEFSNEVLDKLLDRSELYDIMKSTKKSHS